MAVLCCFAAHAARCHPSVLLLATAAVARVSPQESLRAAATLEEWGEPVLVEATFERAAQQLCPWPDTAHFRKR